MTPFAGVNRVTSPYGYREYQSGGRLVKEQHRGIDVVCTEFAGQAVPRSAWTVREVTGGRVLRVGCDAQRGNYVDVQTQPDAVERYQHLAQIDVCAGQSVSQGQTLGLAGSTGNSTGVHLHFGVYRGGMSEVCAVEPSAWLGLPNRTGVYAGEDKQDIPQDAEDGHSAADVPATGGTPPPKTDAPQTGLAVLHIGPASAGDRAALAVLAKALLLPVSETAV